MEEFEQQFHTMAAGARRLGQLTAVHEQQLAELTAKLTQLAGARPPPRPRAADPRSVPRGSAAGCAGAQPPAEAPGAEPKALDLAGTPPPQLMKNDFRVVDPLPPTEAPGAESEPSHKAVTFTDLAAEAGGSTGDETASAETPAHAGVSQVPPCSAKAVNRAGPSWNNLTFERARSSASLSVTANVDPASLVLLPVWKEQHQVVFSSLPTHTSFGVIRSEGDPRTGDVVRGYSKCITRPTSPSRMSWDVLSLLVIMYDVLTLPLQIFGYDDLPFASVMSLGTTMFWTVDVLFSFTVGYHRQDGLVEMRLSRIAKRYLSTWFVPDILIVGVDLILLAADLGQGAEHVDVARAGKSLRTIRITRAVRMLRLVRVTKLVCIFEEICDFVLSGPLLTLLNILRLLFVLALIVHFIACGWYFVAASFSNSDGRGGSWLQQVEGDVESPTMIYRYLVAYQWTMAQFTPAPINYYPTNIAERTYAVCVFFVGLVLFSSLIGSTTALINQSRKSAYEKLREADLVRRFFTDNHVSLELGNRIMHFLKENRRRKKRVAEVDVPHLKILPPSLHMDLHYEVYAQYMKLHPLLLLLDQKHRGAFADVCDLAVCEVALVKGDEPFRYRTPGCSMFTVVAGVLKYFRGPCAQSSRRSQGFGAKSKTTLGIQSTGINAGDWLCEAVLWVAWEHRGLLMAAGSCHVVKIDGDQFGLAVERHRWSYQLLRVYARLFLERLEAAVAAEEQVDDTFQAFRDSKDLDTSFALQLKQAGSEDQARVKEPQLDTADPCEAPSQAPFAGWAEPMRDDAGVTLPGMMLEA